MEAKLVLGLAMEGTPREEIARVIGCTAKTLEKHYGPELCASKRHCDAMVKASLFENAVKHNNVTAQIFYAKTQMGWKEPQVDPFGPLEDEVIEGEFKEVSDRQFGRIIAHAVMVGMKGAYNKAGEQDEQPRQIERGRAG